jgi:hypothetical protein
MIACIAERSRGLFCSRRKTDSKLFRAKYRDFAEIISLEANPEKN